MNTAHNKTEGLVTLEVPQIKIVETMDVTQITNPDIAALVQAIEVRNQAISQIPDPNIRNDLQQKLNTGGIRGSKVFGVNSVAALKTMVSKCTVINFKERKTDKEGNDLGQELIELQLPDEYKAVTIYEREEALNKKGLGHFMFHDGQRSKHTSYILCPASPVLTNSVSFIVDDEVGLKIWYAGPDVLSEHHRPKNLESVWVRLGVPNPLQKTIEELQATLKEKQFENDELHQLFARSGYRADMEESTDATPSN